jgi:hypothetical protein
MYSKSNFGCIYSPIFLCKNEDTTNNKTLNIDYISQIKKRNESEIKIHKSIKTIPYHKLYFHTFFSCEPMHVGIMEDKYLQKQKVETQSSFVLFKYNKLIFDSFESYTTNKSNKFLSDLFIYLLKSIKLLLRNEIVHLNLSKQNIVIVDEMPLITDFSDAQQFNNLFSFVTESSSILELFAIHYLTTNELSSISISNIYDLLNDYKKQYLLDDMNEVIIFLKRFINKPTKQIIEELTKYYYTWDNYSISGIFLSLLQTKYGIHYNTQNQFVLKWIDLMKNNMDPNPLNRDTVESTINKIEKIVFNADINDLID